jgi:hypothetical protein
MPMRDVDLSMQHRINPESPIGEIDRGKRTTSGTVTVLFRTGPGTYRLTCEDHNTAVRRQGYGISLSAVRHPEQWCPGCRKALGLPQQREVLFSVGDGANVGICSGCGEQRPGITTMRHLSVPNSVRLCPECLKPDSPGRKLWDKQVAKAVEEARRNWTGPSRQERERMNKRVTKRHQADFPNQRPIAPVLAWEYEV